VRPLLARTMQPASATAPSYVYDEQRSVSILSSGLSVVGAVVAPETLTKASGDSADSSAAWLLETRTKVGGGDKDDTPLVWAIETRTSADSPEPEPEPRPQPPAIEVETKASSDWPDDPRPKREPPLVEVRTMATSDVTHPGSLPTPIKAGDDLATGVVSF
jgi:hypothetical protein